MFATLSQTTTPAQTTPTPKRHHNHRLCSRLTSGAVQKGKCGGWWTWDVGPVPAGSKPRVRWGSRVPKGRLAQLVERRTTDPEVGGSSPPSIELFFPPSPALLFLPLSFVRSFVPFLLILSTICMYCATLIRGTIQQSNQTKPPPRRELGPGWRAGRRGELQPGC